MLIRKSALINIISAACAEGAQQLIRDFNELGFLKSHRRVGDFVESTKARVLAIMKTQLLKSNTLHGFIAHGQVIQESKTGFSWAVNTIDCIENFTHRLPFFGMCVVLVDHSNQEHASPDNILNCDVLASMFYDPIRDETFWAEKKQGAYMNARKLVLIGNNVQQMKLHESQEKTNTQMIAGIEKNANRNFGSSVMHMAYVAANRLDSACEKIDDVVNILAGKLLVLEAKGVVSIKGGNVVVSAR